MLGFGAEARLPARGHELVMVIRGDMPSKPDPGFIPELPQTHRPIRARQPVVFWHGHDKMIPPQRHRSQAPAGDGDASHRRRRRPLLRLDAARHTYEKAGYLMVHRGAPEERFGKTLVFETWELTL